MTQTSTDFTQTTAASKKEKEAEAAAPPQAPITLDGSQHCDILLNIFQIKKKSYRVLLNYDHIVWERLKTKLSTDSDAKGDFKKAECGTEQLSRRANYGSNSRVLHINELIRVSKGNTKSAALLITAPQPNAEFGANGIFGQQQQQQVISSPPTEQYLALSYATRIVKSATDCNRWEVRKLLLYNEDAYVVRQWHTLLNKMLANTAPTRLRVRRLLVFINPYGGRKTGVDVYERYCKPIFQLAGIDASCILTQRSNQIRDILLSDDLTPFDAICCVGGDGTVAEVINGLLFRAIYDAGLNPRQPAYVPKPALPIAIIPAGSTDTIAYSVHGTADVPTAAIHLILGQRRGMDICSVRNREGILRFCASLLSYGYLGDVAAKSERYRWMGPKRYEFAGVKTFIANNGYEAELRVLQPLSKTSAEARNDTICCANCDRCNMVAAAEAELATKRALLEKAILVGVDTSALDNDELPSSSNDSLKSCGDNSDVIGSAKCKKEGLAIGFAGTESPRNELFLSSKKTIDFDEIKNVSSTDCYKGSEAAVTVTNDNEEKDATDVVAAVNTDNSESTTDVRRQCAQWKTIKGKFFMVSGANITCACTRSPNGVAPYSHIGDGYLDLVLVRKTSLLNSIRLLINMAGRNGDIRNLPFVETYRTKEFGFRSPNASLEEEYSIRGSSQPIAESDFNYDETDELSSWNCDGEVITDQELTMISHCQLIDVFMRGPHTYNKPSKSNKKSFVCCCCGCCKNDD
ncbi:ceramide kinase [Anastrepha obliqua]|uniref:ceramide kinase n=1 Tax=Anastrepha obliqua TaxID=95512 RepID=UPI00240A55D8|nr:ceramide kinase [Anastrepha obliqua]XP_054738578.1 ceramide kinase [Anastrepha obliqua]XP_054738586.1 ceramide kinase [Anastrepha obliqua]